MSELEVEGKVIIVSSRPAEVAEEIAALAQIEGFRVEGRREHQLRDIYFDSPEQPLSRHDAALRLRLEDGRQLIGFKAGGSSTSHLHARREIELEWSAQALAQVFVALALTGVSVPRPEAGGGGSEPEATLQRYGFVPVSARTNQRTALLLRDLAAAGASVELAVDRVRFELATATVRHFEVEAEARGEATEATLRRLLAELERRAPALRPYAFSKLAIGEALHRLERAGRLAPLLAGELLLPQAYDELARLLMSAA